MSFNIRSFEIGSIFYQSGKGYPTHIATKGCTYIDIDTAIEYINKDGLVHWEPFVNNNDASLVIGTLSATSINTVDYIVFNTGTTSATTVAGTVYFDNTEKALSYNTSINQGVTVNLGQQNYIRVFNNSGVDIAKGKALEVFSAYSGLPSVTLAINKKEGFNIVGVSSEIIPNNTEGIAITYGIISNIELTGMSVGSLIYASDTIAGKLDDASKYLTFPLTARTNQVGFVVQTGVTTGKLFVNINNENSVLTLTDLERNVLEGNTLSTGTFEFTGLTKASDTTFNVAPLRGWIVKNTYANALKPDVIPIQYSGVTGQTTPYLLTDVATYVFINSGSTLYLQNTFPTPQQRRENIFLGRIAHPNKTTIVTVNNTVDYDVSPMSSLRDLWTPMRLINEGVVPSPNGANLSFNTSSGTIWGNGVGWAENQLNPNSLTITGSSPTTFQYRTQTGGTYGDTVSIDPAYYDLNGVRTLIGGGVKQSTNQRIYLYPNRQYRVQYGQKIYATLAEAVAGIQSEPFVTFVNNRDNAVLIGLLSVDRVATNLSDTTQAVFTYTSKFGELFGGTGGIATTTLQQAYNNSSQPEIVINSILDGFSIKNGTGNADNVTRLFEGIDTAGNATSFIRADGDISGTTLQTNSFRANNNGITATTISGNSLILSSSASTINLDNPNQQQIKFFSGGTGTPQLSTYSQGAKIIFKDNIDSSISTGYAIGVDAGSLWYGVDLTGNGHDWYAGTRKLASLITSNGFQLFGLGGPTSVAMTISGTSSLGSKGGTGYMDFLRVANNWSAATNTDKWFRTNITGGLEILNSSYTSVILSLTDNGILSIGGGNPAAATSQDATSNYITFNNNNTQIYDDGNTHIHSRGSGQAMWINTNGGQLNLLTQSPTATGGIGSGIAIATGTLNGYVTINTGRTITTADSYGYLTTAGAGTYPGGSQTVSISLYANNRIWGQEIDAFSDERMKNIQGEITLDDGIKLVNNLKPIKYTWKEGEDKGLKAGYSAQQVIKSGFDHLVSIIPNEGLEETIDSDGFMSPKDTQFSMNYDQVTPYHGVVIKHLLEEIKTLKQEINKLKNNNN